jgi:hypothetical protein
MSGIPILGKLVRSKPVYVAVALFITLVVVMAAMPPMAPAQSGSEDPSVPGLGLETIVPASDSNLDEAGTAAPNAPAAINTYLRYPGTAFQPVSSAYAYAYDTWGCVSATTVGFSSFHFPLLLPEGSVVKYVRLYWRNRTTGNTESGTVYLYSYAEGMGTMFSSLSAGSAQTLGTGYMTGLTPYIGETIDNYNNGYVVIWNPAGADQEVCGVRVNYDAPVFASTFLPYVRK